MTRVARYGYLGAAWLFVTGVAVQVFLAGMVVVAARMGWSNHRGFGHLLAAPLIFMLISMYLGRLPGPMKLWTWLLFGVYVLQADVVIFLRGQVPVVAALHPVLALADFALGVMLALRALQLPRAVREPANLAPDLEVVRQ